MSSLAQNQLQAMQLTFFYFLPTMLLSGFMFPFQGMPRWAQAIGDVLPATYFMRLVRGILLKGNDWVDLWPQHLADDGVHRRGDDDRGDLLPQDPGLTMKRTVRRALVAAALAACAGDPVQPPQVPTAAQYTATPVAAADRAADVHGGQAQRFAPGQDMPGAVVDAVPLARARRAGAPGARGQPDARAGAARGCARRRKT